MAVVDPAVAAVDDETPSCPLPPLPVPATTSAELCAVPPSAINTHLTSSLTVVTTEMVTVVPALSPLLNGCEEKPLEYARRIVETTSLDVAQNISYCVAAVSPVNATLLMQIKKRGGGLKEFNVAVRKNNQNHDHIIHSWHLFYLVAPPVALAAAGLTPC
jgi:hypothetical protein